MAVLSQPGSEQRNPLEPQPLSAVDLLAAPGSGVPGHRACLAPRCAPNTCSPPLRNYPRPGAPTRTGSSAPAAAQAAHSTHDLSIWRFMATVLRAACCSGRCETLPGTALCWDLRAARADGTGGRSDSRRMFPKSKL